jgi:enoyl-[acyl-carrier protein] reductase I
MGVANNHSIAWGIAENAGRPRRGASLHYQGAAFGTRVRPLADERWVRRLSWIAMWKIRKRVDAAFADLRPRPGPIDFVVHAIAYSDKERAEGTLRRYVPRELPAR